MKTPHELARHVSELARSFNIQLDVRDIPETFAGAGYRVVVCACGQKNAIKRAGSMRCGACKSSLGQQNPHSVLVAPIINARRYAIALHELGHCVHPTGRVNEFEGSPTMRHSNHVATLRDMRLQLLEETSAWEWAEAMSLEWTDEMANTKKEALGTYYAYASKLGMRPDGRMK